MDPLRVLVVHNRYRSGQPSGEDHVVDQEVALLRSAGHAVERFERRSDDIAAMSLPRKALVPLTVPWNPGARTDMAATVRSFRPDVVHVHNTFPLLSASVLSACGDVPVVATLHNYTQVCPTGTLYRDGRTCTDCVGTVPVAAVRHGCYRGSRAASVPIAVNLMVNRRRWWSSVSRFFCISAAQRSTLVAAGMPASLLSVKYNFVPDAAVRRSGPGSHLLYLGRLTEEKGLRTLMAAWSPSVGLPLVIAGAGPMSDEVAAWAATRPEVRFVGLQDTASARALVSDAVAVVVPSTWQETFGLVVVEAMAAGVPSVVAAHGSLAELVADGVTGLHHLPGNAPSLATAMTRVRSLPGLGAAARDEYERKFTPAVGLANLEAGYREVVSRHAQVVH
jgi:glycosyltransferase involved in cell wall biosynthesis